MLKKITLALCLLTLGSVTPAQEPQTGSLPASLRVGGELVDAKNGFAIRVDQPTLIWSIRKQSTEIVEYLGMDPSTRSAYIVAIDTRRYSEMTTERATKFSSGLASSMQKSGWKAVDANLKTSEIPRRNSYVYNLVAANASGVNVNFVTYFTSPDKLYSIQCLAVQIDDRTCKNLASSFRLLAEPKSDAAPTATGATTPSGDAEQQESSLGGLKGSMIIAALILVFAAAGLIAWTIRKRK